MDQSLRFANAIFSLNALPSGYHARVNGSSNNQCNQCCVKSDRLICSFRIRLMYSNINIHLFPLSWTDISYSNPVFRTLTSMDCCLCCSGCALLINCMPMAFGCPARMKPDGEHSERVCPSCGDAAVSSSNSQTWMKCLFIPVLPLSSRRVWTCSTCDWVAPIKEGWEPAVQYKLEPTDHSAVRQPITSQAMTLPSQTKQSGDPPSEAPQRINATIQES